MPVDCVILVFDAPDDLVEAAAAALPRRARAHFHPLVRIDDAVAGGEDPTLPDDAAAAETLTARLQQHLVRHLLDRHVLATDYAALGRERVQVVR